MKLIDYTFYDPATGRIVLVVNADEVTLPLYEADYSTMRYVPGKYSPDDYWHSTNGMMLRINLSTVASWDDTSIAADGDEAATLSGLPNPSSITIDIPSTIGIAAPAPITVIDGSFVLKVDAPGVFTVTASAFPYKDLITQVTAA